MNPQTRRLRLGELKNIFMKVHFKDDSINYESLIAELMAHWGSKRQTVMEYLDILEQQGFIIVDVLPELKNGKDYQGKDGIRVHAHHKIAWVNKDHHEVKELIKSMDAMYF